MKKIIVSLLEKIFVLFVWYKIDLHPENHKLQQTVSILSKRNIYPICASSGFGLDNLTNGIVNIVLARSRRDVRTIPAKDGKKRAWLYRNGVVESEKLDDENYKMVLRWNEKQRKQFDLL